MKKILVLLITAYQRTLSLDQGPLRGMFPEGGNIVCRYHPTCSQYTKEAIITYGAWRGVLMGGKRILRCNPWSKHPIHDPVPRASP